MYGAAEAVPFVPKFYVAIGFSECPHEPLTLVVTLQEIRAAVSRAAKSGL